MPWSTEKKWGEHHEEPWWSLTLLEATGLSLRWQMLVRCFAGVIQRLEVTVPWLPWWHLPRWPNNQHPTKINARSRSCFVLDKLRQKDPRSNLNWSERGLCFGRSFCCIKNRWFCCHVGPSGLWWRQPKCAWWASERSSFGSIEVWAGRVDIEHWIEALWKQKASYLVFWCILYSCLSFCSF